MDNNIIASFKGDCWDLNAYKYSVRKEYLFSKFSFNFVIILLGIIYAIVDFFKGEYKAGIVILGLVIVYMGLFIFLYFYNSNRFIKELKENIKYVNVEFYENCLIVNQKSKTNNVKSTFYYKEIIRIFDKDDYFFLKFRDITLPFNKKTIIYNNSTLEDIISLMNKYIVKKKSKREMKVQK